jgi:VRR-NUC domain
MEITATEAQYQATILDAAGLLGWKSAHFRPCRTLHGWRTAVGGDGAGFPDLLLVHPEGGFVWFVELKRDDNQTLRPDQDAWRRWLIAAGAVHKVVLVPSGLQPFVADLADANRTGAERVRQLQPKEIR